ncbi:DUF2752 domain-containing protein [Actinocorallia sp. API 0066]|uniref:DUF2752 domain-containing protein n=1 Tax=Actinocorallia sp. API 0066 TaxID=2896846 RepID=UPI001E3A642F|nr:DUF2752 domain-containing protein [Actinocorallia sp. API 0066]MCD0450809.1 DUF2752 domain-containing protein [Actinocorallia sp. API 0066]
MTGLQGVRGRALAGPLAVLAAGAVGVALVAAVDPNEAGHYPTCPFLALTGWACPGCGGLRMTHALAHGRLVEAFGLNPLAFALIPLAAYLWVAWTVAAARGTPVRTGLGARWAVWALTGTILVFWIVRNLPFGQALAP